MTPRDPALSPRASRRQGSARAQRGAATGLLWGVTLVAALTLPKLIFATSIGFPTPFLLYFAAVLAAAYVGGFVSGLVTTVLSAAVGLVLFNPDGWPQSQSIWPEVAVFVLEGIAIALVTSRFVGERERAIRFAGRERTAQDKLQVVLQGVDEGMTLQDREGRIVFANDRAAQIAGCRDAQEILSLGAEELLSRFELFDQDGASLPPSELPGRVLLRGGNPVRRLLRYRLRGTDEERWAVVHASAVRDQRDELRFVVNLFHDVTDDLRQKEELVLAREWLQMALRSIEDSIITSDAEGRINLMNEAAERLTGWRRDEAVGRMLSDVLVLLDENRRSRVQDPLSTPPYAQTDPFISLDVLLVRRDGEEVAVDHTAAPIRHASGSHAGTIVVTRDVSGRRARERRRTFLARATDQLSASLDYKQTLTTVAELAVPLFADWCAVDILEDGTLKRLAVAHVDQKLLDEVHEIHQRYPPDPNSPVGAYNVLRTGKPEMLREIPPALLDAAAKDEEHRRIIHALGLRSYVCAPLKSGGESIGVISCVMAESKRLYDEEDMGVLTNLAERASIAIENARLFAEAERAREEAERAREEAERANRTKDEFLAMLGHELRNPLAPIRTSLDLIALSREAPHEREYTIIERQMRHLVRLVDDLLDVSRITRGRLELERSRVLLAEVIDHAIEMVWPPGRALTHHVHGDIDSSIVVECDPVRMEQIMTNLLVNAAKYTPEGGNVWVTCQRVDGDVEIRVRDDGIGIDAQTLKGVFESFVQAPQALDRARGGLGLGLSIVQGLATAHGGRITADSPGVGRGAEFTLRIPLVARRCESSPTSRVQRHIDDAGSKRVLVVEDNTDAAELLALLIERSGHQVRTAFCGEDALDLAREWKPTHAMLDIGLPGMDGYELARRLKEFDPALVLIAISGYGQPSDRARSLASGFTAHLVKPVSVELLWEHLGGAVRAS